MKNEETIIMQPDNSENTNNVKAEKEVRNGNGKRVAAVAAGAAFGSAAGSAGTAAAFRVAENTQEEVEAQVDDTATATAAEQLQAAAATAQTEQQEEVVATVVDDTQEPDYTGNAGADPVSQDPVAQQTSNETGEVQVLGVYERTDENGVRQEAAVITDGQEVAAIVDVDGNGTADALLADMNHNQQIDEGEVFDISEQNISMDTLKQQYIAQQEMEAQQQQEETFGYAASDETADYNNGVDCIDV
ncbi:MAG: hypothetical protein MR860_06075 [Prevotella sp.]|nr:hypothetical protein [Prevotella sp.]